jgi:hypothetical protein
MPSSNPDAESKKAIADTFLTLDRNFSKLYAACTTDAERTQLTALRDGARDTFWAVQAKSLADSHEVVVQVRQQLKAANSKVAAELRDLTKIVQILKLIAEAVKTAAALASLAAAA